MHSQGTEGWRREKACRLSASRFKDIQGSDKARARYRKDLLEERDEGICKSVPEVAAIRHGKETEDRARAAYELKYACDVSVPGFILHPHYPFVGASSDGLVLNTSGGIEIKCPISLSRHMAAATGVPSEHMPQVTGNIWVLNLEWLDFISYMPGAPVEMFVTRVHRDERAISKLEVDILEFWEYVCTGEDKRRSTKLF